MPPRKEPGKFRRFCLGTFGLCPKRDREVAFGVDRVESKEEAIAEAGTKEHDPEMTLTYVTTTMRGGGVTIDENGLVLAVDESTHWKYAVQIGDKIRAYGGYIPSMEVIENVGPGLVLIEKKIRDADGETLLAMALREAMLWAFCLGTMCATCIQPTIQNVRKLGHVSVCQGCQKDVKNWKGHEGCGGAHEITDTDFNRKCVECKVRFVCLPGFVPTKKQLAVLNK
ncbi:unnamed protein product, partial [Mesorhabditis spiculigera]